MCELNVTSPGTCQAARPSIQTHNIFRTCWAANLGIIVVKMLFSPELFALGSIKSTGQLIYYCRAHTGINTRLTIRTINYQPMTKTKLISSQSHTSHPDTRHMRSSHLFSNEYFIVFIDTPIILNYKIKYVASSCYCPSSI